MATARQRAGLLGIGKLRRTLRRIDGEAQRELREAVDEGAEAILRDMQLLVPKRTGALARLLAKRVARDGLTARVGLVTKKAQRDGFYFRFLDAGTKGAPGRNIKPQRALHIRAKAFDLNRDWIKSRTQRGIALALKRASSGGGAGV
ncbi:MAG: HK97 gp10 family phage protein [Thalassobaculum sp.]